VLPVVLVGVLSAACEAALGLALLFARPGRVGAARSLRAAWYVGLLAAAKALLLLLALPMRSFFLLVLLGWTSAVLALPALGLGTLLGARRREVAPGVRAFAAATLLLLPLGVWGSLVEPRALRVESASVALPAPRALPRALRVAVLADLQTRAIGAHERAAVDALLALEPDLILVPGDVAQLWPRPPEAAFEEFRALLARLEAPLGAYAVRGNSDDPTFLRELCAATPLLLLDDEVAHVERDGLRLAVCGLDLDFGSPRARAALQRLVDDARDDEPRLVLAHLPDAWRALPREGVDLLVAGHTHGGQVVVPGFGPPLTLTGVPRHVAAGGLSELEGRRLYVSRGVGMERGWAPPLRLFCPPEVSLLVLEAAP